MARDTNKNYTDVMIKIGNKTVLNGSVHYRLETSRIEFKMATPAPEGIKQEIEEASDADNLYVNATGASATNPDFHHQHIRFIKVDSHRKIWEFALP